MFVLENPRAIRRPVELDSLPPRLAAMVERGSVAIFAESTGDYVAEWRGCMRRYDSLAALDRGVR